MQDTVSEARAVIDDSGTLETTRAAAERLLAHSHRLAYGTFAPLLGDRLVTDGPFEPPFPPVYYMQQSQLTRFALCVPSPLPPTACESVLTCFRTACHDICCFCTAFSSSPARLELLIAASTVVVGSTRGCFALERWEWL